jgi:hypothetical protein
MPGDARGYSWPPFQPGNTVGRQFGEGNTAAEKHGADRPVRWRPIAERLTAQLLEARPWLAEHRHTVTAWARVEAQIELIGDYLDRCGLLDDGGEPRPAGARLDRLEATALKLRTELALSPLALDRLLGALSVTASTAGSTDALEAAMAIGRQFVDAHLAAQQLPVRSGGAETACAPPSAAVEHPVDTDTPDGAEGRTGGVA